MLIVQVVNNVCHPSMDLGCYWRWSKSMRKENTKAFLTDRPTLLGHRQANPLAVLKLTSGVMLCSSDIPKRQVVNKNELRKSCF
jgi:hypothetical protein